MKQIQFQMQSSSAEDSRVLFSSMQFWWQSQQKHSQNDVVVYFCLKFCYKSYREQGGLINSFVVVRITV